MSPTHRSNNSRLKPQPSIPTLGTTLRLIREDLGLARSTARDRHGISDSYLFEIETDRYVPKLETLEAIIAGYKVDSLLARHLHELRAPAEDLAPVHKLRQSVAANLDWISHLDDLERRGVFAAYVDPIWNVLACNDLFHTALPGIEKTDSIPTWIFSPIAQQVFVDWNREAAHSVAYNKAILGIYRDSQQARDLIRQLGPNKQCRRLWAASLSVTYGRDTDHLLHHRDVTTGELRSYRISIAPHTEALDVYLVTAIGKPYSGPPGP
ncbi:helix-turn-helix domain-containing protein [Nocardia sp. CA-120079]|uniref:helix-turn-helix domain-containing protein n=1 Tax=Nocardia sp. CA-120079 TaxID=3239974 RepID=UPI003D95C86E